MFRCFLTAMLAAFVFHGAARADYLAIKVDLNGVTLTPEAANGGSPKQPAGMGVAAPEMLDPLWTVVYIELKGKQPKPPEIEHKWGKKAYIPTPDIAPFLIPVKITKETPALEFVKRLAAAKKNPDLLMDAAKWAWSHGIMKEFHAAVAELKKTDAAVAESYKKVQDQLKAPLTEDDPALKSYLDELTKQQGFRPLHSDKGHYTLYTNLPRTDSNDAHVKRRLAKLEQVLESFYYWFALQKDVPVPPMPRYRLVGVLYNSTEDFFKKNAEWEHQPMLGDGFTPRRDNVMILASKRLDYAYSVLEEILKNMEKTLRVPADEALNGETYWKNPNINQQNSTKYAILQTMTLVRKAMEEESERTTLSHEAVRQLIAASGLLPRAIAAPEWIQAGLASYFETPFGSVYGAGGLPSWSNLIGFKYQRSKGLIKGRDALLGTITDRYFDSARRASTEVREQRDQVSEKIRGEWERARSTSWALCYYLIRSGKFNDLARYTNELAQLPRDLELDTPTLEACFARAFDLTDAKSPHKLNATKLQAFADAWFAQMENYSFELSDVERTSLQTRTEMATPKKKTEAP